MLPNSFHGWPLLSALVLTAGCASDVEGPGGSGGQGGHAGQGGAPPATCESAPGDHADICSAERCAIVLDVEVSCGDFDFAAGGVRALPVADATYLATSSNAPTRVFDVTSGIAERLELPLQAASVNLARGADGQPYAAADETSFGGGGYPGGVVFLPLRDVAAKQTVFDRDDKGLSVYDLAFDPNGAAHLWFNADAPSGLSLAKQTAAGWEISAAPIPAGTDWTRFGLAPDGGALAFGFAESGAYWRLWVLDAGTERALGGTIESVFPWDYEPIATSPEATIAGAPRYAAVVQHETGLRVARATASGFEEEDVPGSAMLDLACPIGFGFGSGPPCPADCHETASGLVEPAFGAVRTDDGDVFVAVATSHIDWVVRYETQDIDGMEACVGNVVAESDESRGELTLVRLPVSGDAAEPLFTLDLPAIAFEDRFIEMREQHPLVHVSALGEDITVAVRTQASRTGPFTARVLRVDTALLEAR